MRALDVNLASQPFRNNTLLWVGYGLGFIVLLSVLSWNVSTWLQHRGFQKEAEQRLDDMDSRLAELDRREAVARREANKQELALTTLTVQAAAANEVIERKAFSWTRLFNRVEESIPWNVHLTSMRPLFRAQRDRRAAPVADERKSIVVSVEGYAKELGAFLEFESALFAHPSFDFPEPKRYQFNERKELVFELDFTYYPDEVDEDKDVVEAAKEGEDDDGGDVDAASGGAETAGAEPAAADGPADDQPDERAVAEGGSDPADGPVADEAVAGDVGGEGPAEAMIEGDAAPLEGVPAIAGAAGDGAGDAAIAPPAEQAATASDATEPNAARPGQQPPRIPPPPYAKPGDDSEQKKAKPPTRRAPPRRRADKKDEDDGR